MMVVDRTWSGSVARVAVAEEVEADELVVSSAASLDEVLLGRSVDGLSAATAWVVAGAVAAEDGLGRSSLGGVAMVEIWSDGDEQAATTNMIASQADCLLMWSSPVRRISPFPGQSETYWIRERRILSYGKGDTDKRFPRLGEAVSLDLGYGRSRYPTSTTPHQHLCFWCRP